MLTAIQGHYLPPEAAAPHLRVVLALLLALAFFRLIFVARLAAAAACSALLGVMIAYYGLVLIGLQSWGRVITWELIAAYGRQAPQFADALGVSLPLTLAAAGLAWLALLAGAWLWLGRFDWAPLVRGSLSTPAFAVLVGVCAALCAIETYNFVAGPPTARSEPLALTLFPDDSGWNADGHVIPHLTTAKLDAAEDAARAAYRPSPAAERRNVILIVVDALRPDHMGIYGYRRDTTPNLSRLERAGLLRKSAALRAACSSSICGLVSIGASRFVHQISARPIMLQEVLRRHGYRAHLVLAGDHTSFYELRGLYGEVDSYFDAATDRKRYYANDDRLVLDRLAALAPWDGQPVMLQLHLMSAHALSRREAAAVRYTPQSNYALYAYLPSDGAERAINFYDNGVLQADAVIGEILALLERKGYLGDALVAITADHGEMLGEHRIYQHGTSVYEGALHVPLVLLSYGYRPRRPLQERSIASQADIAPTILAELGMPLPATWHGVPLQAAATREFLHFQQMSEAGIFDLRDPANLWKYWSNTRSGAEYAFNLTLDPGEQRNAIEEVPPQLRRDWRRELLANAPATTRQRPSFLPAR